MILLKIECTLRIKLLVCGFCIEKFVNYACLWQCFEAHCIHLKGYKKISQYGNIFSVVLVSRGRKVVNAGSVW